METPSTAGQTPATYAELNSLRVRYATTFFAVLILGLCISGFVRILTVSGEAQGASEAIPPALLCALSLIPGVGVAITNGIFAQKIGLKTPVIAAILGVIPMVNWVAFFIIIGHLPKHLAEFEPQETPPPMIVWLIIGGIPILIMGLLTGFRPEYMAQLFVGPPLGSYIPGLPIPCGWPILAVILIAVVMTNLPLYLGFQKGYVRGWWKLLLVILVLVYFTFPAIYLVVLGPATIQLCKAMFGCQ